MANISAELKNYIHRVQNVQNDMLNVQVFFTKNTLIINKISHIESHQHKQVLRTLFWEDLVPKQKKNYITS